VLIERRNKWDRNQHQEEKTPAPGGEENNRKGKYLSKTKRKKKIHGGWAKEKKGMLIGGPGKEERLSKTLPSLKRGGE